MNIKKFIYKFKTYNRFFKSLNNDIIIINSGAYFIFLMILRKHFLNKFMLFYFLYLKS